MDYQTIPLNQLVQSELNVRRTNVKQGIEELAASIEAHGLRQNLNVKKVGKQYEVVAGQRRLLALQHLAKKKKIDPDYPVPCSILTDTDDAAEISLAENTMREAMHPDDQFEAFNNLIVEGKPVEDVAARFGVTPAVVRQRMKLASVSPKLRAIFRKGEMTLEQVMAFTLTDDHKKQEKVWKEAEEWNRDPDDIRSALTENTVQANSRLATFVGVAEYEAAGGKVTRDLFDTENEGYLEDGELLQSLAEQKLEKAAEDVRAEGWKWVKPEIERTFQNYGRVHPGKNKKFSAEDMARAGAKVFINYSGELEIDRGLVLAQDMPKEKREEQGIRVKEKGAYSEKLLTELSMHRTAAMRLALTEQPDVAMIALAYTLALETVYDHAFYAGSALQISINERYIEVPNPEECEAHAKLEAMLEDWRKKLPKEEAKLWDWLFKQDRQTVTDLTVFCVAMSANAVVSKNSNFGPQAHDYDHADQLAKTLKLDMSERWKPSGNGFYSRLSKVQMADAMKEARVEQTKIDHMLTLKKADAAVMASTGLRGTGWLPAALRNNKKKEKAA